MLRSYRYRLKPTRAQARILDRWIMLTRELYNAALQERRDAWEKQRVRRSLFDQMRDLPAVREVRPEFMSIPISVLRGSIRRLDRAFAEFFRRCKTATTPGYPRFKGRGRFDSILIDDLHGRYPVVAGGKRVNIPLLGKIKFKQHRPLEGTPKAMRLTLRAGRWYVTFACVDVPARPLPPTDADVGLDLGLTTFAATSDGELIAPPNYRDARLHLERAQRRVSRRKRGSGRRRAAVRLLARAHEHAAAVRREHRISVARSLVARYGRIYVEKLNIKGLARGMLAGPVNRAGWGDFLHWLRVKAESAGREVVEVSPAGTSQICSECGGEVRKGLSVRVHRCPCGYVADRDVNAARNVLRAGLALRGGAAAVSAPRRSVKSKSLPRPEHTAMAHDRGRDTNDSTDRLMETQ